MFYDNVYTNQINHSFIIIMYVCVYGIIKSN